MYNDVSYQKISNKCKSTIREKSPEESIKIISNLKSPTSGKNIGEKDALKIYNVYSNESVKYDSKLYKNNINDYSNKINSNIEKAYHSTKKC
jgi:hypothetical protein